MRFPTRQRLLELAKVIRFILGLHPEHGLSFTVRGDEEVECYVLAVGPLPDGVVDGRRQVVLQDGNPVSMDEGDVGEDDVIVDGRVPHILVPTW